jgi:hypothetical protein
MKKRDITVIATIAVIAGILSLVVSNLLFGGNKVYDLKAPKVEPISAEFITPDTRYFNGQSIDPTVDIQIGDNNNPDALNN